MRHQSRKLLSENKASAADDGRRRRRLKDRSGFSLAELLITIAIMGIVAAFGSVAVIQHQRSLKRTEMDDTAREIFTAAQNHLTESASTGTWKQLYNSALQGGEAASVLGEDAADEVTEASDYPEGEGSDESSSSDHDFRRIVYPAADGEEVPKAWSVLLPEGSIDETVRTGGSYVIEYDAKTAQIYGVFYTDNSEGVSTSDVDALNTAGGRKDASVRQAYTGADGNRLIIGYYGGALGVDTSATTDSTVDTDEPYPLQNVNLSFINGPRLLLVVDDPNLAPLAAAMAGKNYTCTITVSITDESGNRATVGTITTGNTASNDADGTTDGGSYVYVLDSVGDPGYHFREKFPDLTPGENLTASATVTLNSDGGTQSIDVTSKNSANSLFADTSGGSTAVVENARHLENLSTDISGVSSVTDVVIDQDISWNDDNADASSNDYIYDMDVQRTAYGLTKLPETPQVTYLSSDGTSTITGTEKTFYGIVNEDLQTVTGANDSEDDKEGDTSSSEAQHTLSDFVISGRDDTGESAGIAALFTACTDSQSLTISDLSLSTFTAQGDTASAALVGESEGTLRISGVSARDCVVGTEGDADQNGPVSGILIADADKGQVSVTGCTLSGTNTVYGTTAGGFIGRAGSVSSDKAKSSSTLESLILSDCSAADGDSLSVQAWNEAGGVIGSVADNGVTHMTLSSVTLSSDLTVTGTSSGGLVGRLCAGSAKVTDCAVTGSNITIKGNETNGLPAAGGLFGSVKPAADGADLDSLVVSSCSVGRSDSSSVITLESARHAGGLIGQYNLQNVASESGDTMTISSSMVLAKSLTVHGGEGATAQHTFTAAGLVGEIMDPSIVTIQNSTVSADSITLTADGTVSGKNSHLSLDAGGLVGEIDSSANTSSTSPKNVPSVTLTGDTISADTSLDITAGGSTEMSSYSHAGGAIGSVYSSKSRNPAVISTASCTVFVGTDGTLQVQAGDAAGGFAGVLDNADKFAGKIMFSLCSVNGGKSGLVKSTAGDAGGSIGLEKMNLLKTGAVAFSGCAASVLVESDGNKSSVGGFAGSVTNATFAGCYAAGRTGSGQYGTGYDANVLAGGRWGIAGGFAGILGKNSAVNGCYTTASVSASAGNATAGGFAGVLNGRVDNSYTTALVTSSGTAGLFAGSGSGKGFGNYYLQGINSDSLKASGSGKTGVSVTGKSSNDSDGPFCVTAGGSAAPYDTTIGTSYPYKTVAMLMDSTGTSSYPNTHVGDWPVSRVYTIHFDANVSDGSVTGTMSDMTGVPRGTDVTLSPNLFTRNGYQFAGWTTDAAGKGTLYADKESVRNLAAASDTVTLYAQWVNLTSAVFTYVDSDEYPNNHIQTFTAPVDGIYELEVWGAQGGSGIIAQNGSAAITERDTSSAGAGGKGGYARTYVRLTAGDVVYVYIGGAGDMSYVDHVVEGGWNGGGNAKGESSSTNTYLWGSGGGASCMTILKAGESITSFPELSSYSNSKDDVVLVAGGGGGAGGAGAAGGAGGGSSGGNGSVSDEEINKGHLPDSLEAKGGTQTAGGAGCGKHYVQYWNGTHEYLEPTGTMQDGSFGEGGGADNTADYTGEYRTSYGLWSLAGALNGAGGGGGWYGGGMGYSYGCSAGGGSGYYAEDSTASWYVDRSTNARYDPVLIAGDQAMPDPLDSDSTMAGREGSGCGRITLVQAGSN